MKQLGVAIIGTGGISETHIRGYLSLEEEVKIKALCDILPQRAQAKKEKFALAESYVCQDFMDVLKDSEVDAVSICAPNDVHVPIALEAIKASKAILCEKPVGLNTKEVKELEVQVRASGVPFMVGFTYRFVPAIRYIKELVTQGALGDIYQLHAHFFVDRLVDTRIGLEWRMEQERSGTGVLGDLGSHLIDLVRFVAGFVLGKEERCCGQLATKIQERTSLQDGAVAKVTTDDLANFLITYESGAVGSFSVGRIISGKQILEINGSQGSIHYDIAEAHKLLFRAKEHNQGFAGATYEEYLVPSRYDPHSPLDFWARQVQHFVRCLLAKEPLTPSIEDGLVCQEVLDAIHKHSIT